VGTIRLISLGVDWNDRGGGDEGVVGNAVRLTGWSPATEMREIRRDDGSRAHLQ